MAIAWAHDLLREKAWKGYRFAFTSWQAFATSPNAGDLPDPPEPPED